MPEYTQENLGIFGFNMTAAELETLSNLEKTPAPAVRKTPAAPGQQCQLYYNSTTVGVPGTQCWRWDLSKVPGKSASLRPASLSLVATCYPFALTHSCRAAWVGQGTGGKWAVPNPCAAASPVAAGCTQGATADAAAYELRPLAGGGTECVPVGSIHDGAFTPYGATVDSGSGVHLEYYGARGSFAYDLICSDNQQGGPDFANGVGPAVPNSTRESPSTVVWLDKAFCPMQLPGPCPPSLPPAPAPPLPPAPPPPPAPPWGTVPVPTAAQLAYYDSEIRALVRPNLLALPLVARLADQKSSGLPMCGDRFISTWRRSLKTATPAAR